jgi:tetratricopeptide (TPR) repeat protein
LYRLGRLDEAIEYLRRALELIPDSEIAAHLGEVLWVKGDKREARKVWETALKATPGNVLLQDVIQRFNP